MVYFLFANHISSHLQESLSSFMAQILRLVPAHLITFPAPSRLPRQTQLSEATICAASEVTCTCGQECACLPVFNNEIYSRAENRYKGALSQDCVTTEPDSLTIDRCASIYVRLNVHPAFPQSDFGNQLLSDVLKRHITGFIHYMKSLRLLFTSLIYSFSFIKSFVKRFKESFQSCFVQQFLAS